jgi:hypothetical protein
VGRGTNSRCWGRSRGAGCRIAVGRGANIEAGICRSVGRHCRCSPRGDRLAGDGVGVTLQGTSALGATLSSRSARNLGHGPAFAAGWSRNLTSNVCFILSTRPYARGKWPKPLLINKRAGRLRPLPSSLMLKSSGLTNAFQLCRPHASAGDRPGFRGVAHMN